jgi:hypothetical protein
MVWAHVPTPQQLLAWVDRLIGLRHRQMAELHHLRRMLQSHIFLVDAIKRREEAPQAARRRDGPRRRTVGRMYRRA